MPTAIPNGDPSDDPTTSEAAAYNSSISIPAGDRTPEEQATVDEYEGKVTRIGAGKTDSGGTGGRQAAVAVEVGRTIAEMERNRKKSIDQWATKAARGGPEVRRAQSEMHGADSATLSSVLFLLYELRERLNDSPY
jgi:hypothetical protein